MEFNVEYTMTLTVEAEDEEEALEKANEMAYSMYGDKFVNDMYVYVDGNLAC